MNKIIDKKLIMLTLVMGMYIFLLSLYFIPLKLLKSYCSIQILNICGIVYFLLISFLYPKIIHKYKDKIKKIFNIS